MSASEVPAYILAGGKSERFGADKARVVVGERPMLLHLRQTLQDCGHSVAVIADHRERFADLGFDCLEDTFRGNGPVAGLAAALQHAMSQNKNWVLLVSCDQLRWLPEWSGLLCNELDSNHQAICFGTDGEQAQPLPAMYHVSLEGSAMQLAQQSRGLRRVLAVARIKCVQTAVDPASWSFNTPAELQFLLQRLSAKGLRL